jgi:TPP-dependent pyruvate/acetoin dehydrogenase alpha subunit
MDVQAVEAATRRAARSIRDGGGPFLLEARTFRFRAHSMYDPESYRSKDEVERWKESDPIAAFAGELRREGLLTDEPLATLEASVVAEIDAAVQAAEDGPWEPVEDLTRDVLAP